MKAVPPSVREAALGIGASPVQMVFDHVLPLAMPGMLSGAIIGTARALGESAPLLMIGMVAFIVDIPTSITSPATVLPVQIYLWADSPERAFTERTSAAILVLLVAVMLFNARRLARYFGTSAEFWIGMQGTYDLEMARDRIGERIVTTIHPRAA